MVSLVPEVAETQAVTPAQTASTNPVDADIASIEDEGRIWICNAGSLFGAGVAGNDMNELKWLGGVDPAGHGNPKLRHCRGQRSNRPPGVRGRVIFLNVRHGRCRCGRTYVTPDRVNPEALAGPHRRPSERVA